MAAAASALGRALARGGGHGPRSAAARGGGRGRGRGVYSEAGQREGPSLGFYDTAVEEYAQMPTQEASLQAMFEQGTRAHGDPEVVMQSANHILRELPKRLARRLLDLQFLPYIVVINPHINRVYDGYYKAFQALRSQPAVTSADQNRDFTKLLMRLIDQHAPMIDSLAAGLRECLRKPIVGEQLDLDGFFDQMLTSRIARRVMAEQHIAMSKRREGFAGVICLDLDIQEALEFAAKRTRQICTATYGVAPEVRVSGAVRTPVSYIPTHLDYMLYELLKNAMRATVEEHKARAAGGGPAASALPPVDIRVMEGEQLTIRISDQGGGVHPDAHAKVWRYGFTTVRPDSQLPPDVQQGQLDFSHPGGSRAVGGGGGAMAGLGFGLPFTRLHARYWGGDLRLQSMQGYGTDVHLRIANMKDAL